MGWNAPAISTGSDAEKPRRAARKHGERGRRQINERHAGDRAGEQ
jgi:hypothetical protein